MKKMLRICLLTILCMTFVTLGGFLALTWYYGRTFVVNTWINGIYCTGMTVEEVNGELVRNMEIPELTIIDGEGQSWPLDLSLADYRVDYTDSLQAYLRRRQSAWLRQEEMTQQHMFPQASWSHEKLRELVAGMDWVREDREKSMAVEIRTGREGEFPYILYDGKRSRLDTEKLCDYVQQCVERGIYQVQVRQGDCYEDLEDTEADLLQRMRYAKLQSFL